MPFRPGDQLGDYEILRLLGAGGMGEVYQVRNVLSDRVEAIKVLSAGLQANIGLQDRFLREIKISASLRHPHIAELRTAQRVDGLLIMVMEFVDGVTIDELLREGAIPVKNALHYTGQVLDALAYAHACGVVHRDIKPQNMMVTDGENLHLMDFGIARSLADQGMTMTGMTLGSLYYMSPEQIRGEEVDARTDIYSLGISLYEMATGSKPFDGISGYTVMAAHLDQPPMPPVERNPALPDAVNDLILCAIAKRPEDRFANASSFQAALLRLQGSLPGRLDHAPLERALASRAEREADDASVRFPGDSPTETMSVPVGQRAPASGRNQGVPGASTPGQGKGAGSDAVSEPTRSPRFWAWLGTPALLLGLVGVVAIAALVSVFGPGLFRSSPSQEQETQAQLIARHREASAPESLRSNRGLPSTGPTDGNGERRGGRPPDEELRQSMQQAEDALREAGVDFSLFGPESREGRRFVALERAEAMLAIARRYSEAHQRQQAIAEKRRGIPSIFSRIDQRERQSIMGGLGEQWRQVTERMAAAEAAIKSQNLRLAGDELAAAEVSMDFLEKAYGDLEKRYGPMTRPD
jgi:serine/threonine protein kinase